MSTMRLLPKTFGALCAVLLFGASINGSQAATATFPARVTIMVGTDVGSGYDQYARLAAHYLERDLPGHPSVVTKSMTGAGGVRMLTWLYNNAEKDGSAIGTMPAGAAFDSLLDPTVDVTFDATQFKWLISLDRLANILTVWHTAPAHSVDDVFKEEIILGNVSGPTAVVPLVLNQTIGSKFKVVSGYAGTSGVALALERGEVQGTINLSWDTLKATKANWLKEKKVRLLMQITFHPIPELQNVPAISDYVKSEERRNILEILLAKQELGRPFMAPPGTSEQVVTVYRQAFEGIVRDPDFLAMAKKQNLSIDPSTGAQLEKFVKHIFSMPKPTVAKLQEEIKEAKRGVVKRKGVGSKH